MSKTRTWLVAAFLLGVPAAALRAEPPNGGQTAEASPEVLLDSIRSNRKAMVAANLELTGEEAAKFWPVYDRYQKEINAIGDRWIAVIDDYVASFPDLSNEKATKIVEDYLAVEADRVQVRRAYVPDFAAVLSGRKVALLYQIENKMDAVIRYDLAASIPVISAEPSVPAK